VVIEFFFFVSLDQEKKIAQFLQNFI
jgi:hypothetical protein